MDYKSKLQILLQKSSNDLPYYYIHQQNDAPPFKYSCQISFKIKGKLFQIWSTNSFNSKKEAEQNAAQQSLLNINETFENEYQIKSYKSSWNQVFVFIDYENYNDDIKIDKFKECNPLVNVVKYASIFNPRESTADVKVNSNRSDATDIKICCDVGVIFNTDINSLIYIVTRDHFASCLSDLYTNCYHVVSIDQCFTELTMLVSDIKTNTT